MNCIAGETCRPQDEPEACGKHRRIGRARRGKSIEDLIVEGDQRERTRKTRRRLVVEEQRVTDGFYELERQQRQPLPAPVRWYAAGAEHSNAVAGFALAAEIAGAVAHGARIIPCALICV